MTKVIFMDLARCVNCRACEVACEREHAGNANMFVQLIDERFALPLNCRHCDESFCTVVCPTQAVHRISPDAVIVSPMKCIGCELCTLACPFGSIWPDQVNRVARKCDLCQHRTQVGLEPACVTTCSARALVFGEFDVLLAKAKKKDETSFVKGRLVVNRAAGKTGTILMLPDSFGKPLPDTFGKPLPDTFGKPLPESRTAEINGGREDRPAAVRKTEG